MLKYNYTDKLFYSKINIFILTYNNLDLNYKKIIIDFYDKIPKMLKSKILSNKNVVQEKYEKIEDSMIKDLNMTNKENKIKVDDLHEMSDLKLTFDYSEINSSLTQVLTYILNFENIFLNFENKSMEITYDLILLLIENKLIDSPHLVISFLNKLIQFSLHNHIEKEYLSRLKTIMENLKLSCNLNNHIQSLRFTYDKIDGKENFQFKNFKKFTEILDEELESSSITEDLINKNFSLSSSIDMEFDSLENFKSKVNQNLKSEDLLKVYRELKHESQLIEDAINNRIYGVSFFSGFSN